jgi:hypothetical protein
MWRQVALLRRDCRADARENAVPQADSRTFLGCAPFKRVAMSLATGRKERAQIAIVVFGNRALEDDLWIGSHKLGMRSAAESLSTVRRMAFHQSS